MHKAYWDVDMCAGVREKAQENSRSLQWSQTNLAHLADGHGGTLGHNIAIDNASIGPGEGALVAAQQTDVSDDRYRIAEAHGRLCEKWRIQGITDSQDTHVLGHARKNSYKLARSKS